MQQVIQALRDQKSKRLKKINKLIEIQIEFQRNNKKKLLHNFVRGVKRTHWCGRNELWLLVGGVLVVVGISCSFQAELNQ